MVTPEKLNLPESPLRLRKDPNGVSVFDTFRKKYVRFTPEEWVRQQTLSFLCEHLGYPKSLISVETSLRYNEMEKRADAVVFKNVKPVMIIECKASSVQIDQGTFDQIARYNYSLRVDYLLVTNGLNHFICRMDYERNTFTYLRDIPSYEAL